MKIEPGTQVGAWMVLTRAADRGPQAYWTCRCECGTEREVQGASLRYGGTSSCGCRRDEALRVAWTKHGMATTALYRSWLGMRQRCENPNDNGYAYYGARGIAVCERWSTFEPFRDDMGATWFPGATLERREVNGPYEPSNCCWIPRNRQSRNRRNVPLIDTPWGPLTLPELGAKIGVSAVQMAVRYRKGWRGDKLLSPAAEKGARVTPRKKRLD